MAYSDMVDVDRALEVADLSWGKEGFDPRSLPRALRTVHLIGRLDSEVNMGGVYGWLINMGEYGPDTVKALEAVGAHQCATIVREILAFFAESSPAFDCRERTQQMEDIGETGEKAWRDLGNRLLAWPDNIYILLQQFINEHEADFT